MDALLAAPDRSTAQGRRDHRLLLFLYNSGARASEAADMRIGDVDWHSRSARILGKGNKDMASCNVRVHEMLAVAQATATLVSLESSMARQQAALCAEACKRCKEACAEHRARFAHGMHLACKDCMEACERCEAACRAFAA